jgi:hypothetical protein
VSDATWLPNLVGGTSIWKLAVDLNEPKFFDGRLLVPETEGSESLPVTVRWDLTGLIPLSEARQQHPEAVTTALAEFQAALARVAKVFSTPNSGFDKYKEAFTVPSLEADQGANYFFSAEQKKLFVINWGASPRSMGGKAEYVFGYEDWGKHWTAAAAGAAVVAAAATVAASAVAPNKDEAKQNDEAKAKKKDESKPRAWWFWPLFGLVAIVLVLLALFLLKACEDQKTGPDSGAADALAEGAASSDGATGNEGGSADGAAGGGLDGGDDAGGSGDAAGASDAAADAGADAASTDGGKDAGKDGAASDDDDDDDDFPTGSSGGAGTSGGAGSSGGTVVVKVGPGGGQKTSVHRKHYSDEAQKWRVAGGAHKVSRTEQAGRRFDVWLSPGQTFEGVRVEWQDKAGKWHVH